ncbi:MAG: lipid-A-disaccharide synthase [Akkermansiaceae bacterium]|nr:lipid-A-disaccharide synthase [Akkermansiaceae bacterium]NNM29255.1 lipid-A-disaccharide synthase [Akkermansiaceae bacterium]
MGTVAYFVAGEHSGDTRGAELMGALRERRPDWEFAGLGGPKMRALGGDAVRDWVEDAAVVGLWEVLKRYGWFKRRFEETKAEIARRDPDAVILVDYPGFNLRLARALREGGSRCRIIDYISPQVWAWNKGRIPRMARWLDLMLCLFPFEREMFESAGLKTVWMGHPLVDQLEAERIPAERGASLVGLFPGSREREVARLFPLMLETARSLAGAGWTFEASAASAGLAATMRRLVDDSGLQGVVEVREGDCHGLMQRATCGVVASGTATLEAAFYGMPYCLVYKVAWPTFWVARMVVNLDHIGIVNILAGRQVVPEFVQGDARADDVAAWIADSMRSPGRRSEMSAELLETAAKLGEGGAAGRAAEAIIELLEHRE